MTSSFASFKDIIAEGIVKQDKQAMWYEKKYKGRLGDIILTNERLAFNSHGNPFAGPLLKLLFKKEGSGIKLDIPFAAMKNAAPYSYMGNKKLFKIILQDNTEYYFMPISNHEEWINTLNQNITSKK